MSTEEMLEEARDLIGELFIRAGEANDQDKHDFCTVLYNLTSVIREMKTDIESIKADMQELKHK